MGVDTVGFKTAEGSIYKWDQDTYSTTRLKMSPGTGQGQWQQTYPCLFAREAKFDKARIDYERPGISIRLGWITADGKILNIMGAENRLDIAPNGTPVIAWVNNHSNQAVVTLGALTDPEIGFKPVEKFYTADGQSHTHFSNSSIVKIYTHKNEMSQDIEAALRGHSIATPTSPSLLNAQFTSSSHLTADQSEALKRAAVKKSIADGINPINKGKDNSGLTYEMTHRHRR